MPKITGPCLNVQAQGSLANVLTYLKTKRGSVCKKKSKPSGPPTQDQLYVREMFRFLQQEWPSRTDYQKATWLRWSAPLRISQNNAYLANNLDLWTNFIPPHVDPYHDGVGRPGLPLMMSGVKLDDHIDITLQQSIVFNNWGAIIYAKQPGTAEHKPEDLIQIHSFKDNQPHTYTFYPPNEGFWTFKYSLFSVYSEFLHDSRGITVPFFL